MFIPQKKKKVTVLNIGRNYSFVGGVGRLVVELGTKSKVSCTVGRCFPLSHAPALTPSWMKLLSKYKLKHWVHCVDIYSKHVEYAGPRNRNTAL